MDRKFQDISIVDKNFRDEKLVIPRESQIRTITFYKDNITIIYINSLGYHDVKTINYELLENGKKLVID